MKWKLIFSKISVKFDDTTFFVAEKLINMFEIIHKNIPQKMEVFLSNAQLYRHVTALLGEVYHKESRIGLSRTYAFKSSYWFFYWLICRNVVKNSCSLPFWVFLTFSAAVCLGIQPRQFVCLFLGRTWSSLEIFLDFRSAWNVSCFASLSKFSNKYSLNLESRQLFKLSVENFKDFI